MDTHAQPLPPELASLAAAYDQASADVKAASERKASLAAQLKLACETVALAAGQAPDTTRVVLEGDTLAVRVTPVETWRVDAKRLKAEQAPLYAAYAVCSTSYRLEVVPA